MARGESERSPVQSQFVVRVSRLPVVTVAWDYAANTYSSIKCSSRLLNFAISNAERTAVFVARPVVRRFEKQIQVVDDLACRGLDTLEENVPLVTKPADEIIVETKKMYSDTLNSRIDMMKKYGNEKLRTAADYGLKRANAILGEKVVKSLLSSVDGVLVTTQTYVDQFLPPTKEETQQNGKIAESESEKETRATRVLRIATSVRHRALATARLQLEHLQEKTFDLLLLYPLQAAEFSKVRLESAIDYANKLWTAITRQEVDEKNAEERTRLQEQLLEFARQVSRQVANAYAALSGPADSRQEPSQFPTAVVAVRDGALWVIGMIRITPKLLPTYMYGLVSWLEQIRSTMKKSADEKPAEENQTAKPNGMGPNGQVPPDNGHSNHSALEESQHEG